MAASTTADTVESREQPSRRSASAAPDTEHEPRPLSYPPPQDPSDLPQAGQSEFVALATSLCDVDAFPNVENTDGEWPMLPFESINDPWLLDNDFDLAAIESDIAATMADWARPPQLPVPDRADQPTPRSRGGQSPECPPIPQLPSTCEALLQSGGSRSSKIWYNRLQPVRPAAMSRQESEGPSSGNINELYRQDLSMALEPRAFQGALPPVDFLNLSLELYFERFHPIFPIVHKGTFRPNRAESLLFLSMCSVGSLYIGTEEAATFGTDLFRRLNKAILASWEQHMSRPAREALCMVQAALLGQTFGFMSGNPSDVYLAEAFHGTLVSWVRNVAIPIQRAALPNSNVVVPITKREQDRIWTQWSFAEQQARLILGLRVHDAELASMFHHHPALRHNALTPTFMNVNDELFNAADAEAWMQLQHKIDPFEAITVSNLSDWTLRAQEASTTVHKAVTNSAFAAYSILQSTSAYILELRASCTLDDARKHEVVSGLVLFWSLSGWTRGADPDDAFNLRSLWHSNFMSLSVDFDLLERAIGRDGASSQATALGEAQAWSISADCLRCMLHAILLYDNIEAMHIGKEMALHIGRSLFHAGVLWTVLARIPHEPRSPVSRFRELQPYGDTINCAVMERSGINAQDSHRRWRKLAYRSVDLLQRLSKWGLNGNFATLIAAALPSNT